MNPQNPTFRKEYKCNYCGHEGAYILKMGGLLCEECRAILFDSNTPEWREAFQLDK